jgi:hypothetical protein
MKDRSAVASRWAPWWAYLVPVVGINQLRQAMIAPSDVGDAVSVALFATTTILVALVVTVLYRLLRA